MRILNVVGARPNLIKMAALIEAMRSVSTLEQILLHTGQHYDARMSDIFFDQLGLPQPAVFLNVGSGSHAQQTAAIMAAFEPALVAYQPDVVVVVGDVNSTLACALVADKLNIEVAHVEAGLRSFDRTMPEEVNRVLTDAISGLLFTPSDDGDANLWREGVPPERIYCVGNVMVDTLLHHRERAMTMAPLSTWHLETGNFALLTLHRPSNVDDPQVLEGILRACVAVQERLPVVFPIHPRTQHRLDEFGLAPLLARAPRLYLVEPLGYLEFLGLMAQARVVLTDSGGIQEETTVLGVPCLTLRENTERPITITHGTNRLVGPDPGKITQAVDQLLSGGSPMPRIPPLWDGCAAQRIVAVLEQYASG